jgi:hypothetical protein
MPRGIDGSLPQNVKDGGLHLAVGHQAGMARVAVGDVNGLDAAVALELAGCLQAGHRPIAQRVDDVQVSGRAGRSRRSSPLFRSRTRSLRCSGSLGRHAGMRSLLRGDEGQRSVVILAPGEVPRRVVAALFAVVACDLILSRRESSGVFAELLLCDRIARAEAASVGRFVF